MATSRQVKELADRLISTLDDSFDPDKADAVVRDVAEALYTDVLGIPGRVVVDQSKPVARVHGSFGKGKRAMVLAHYKFKPDQEAGEA